MNLNWLGLFPLLLLEGGLSSRTTSWIWRFLVFYWKNFYRSRMPQAAKTRRFLLQMQRTRELQSNCLSPSVWLRPWSSISDLGWWNTGLVPKEGKLCIYLACVLLEKLPLLSINWHRGEQTQSELWWRTLCSVAFHKPLYKRLGNGLDFLQNIVPHLLLPPASSH